jgi:hypothetical protein
MVSSRAGLSKIMHWHVIGLTEIGDQETETRGDIVVVREGAGVRADAAIKILCALGRRTDRWGPRGNDTRFAGTEGELVLGRDDG